MSVHTGIEVLREDCFRVLHGKRVGLLTNPSAVDRFLRSTVDILRTAKGVNLVALFSPEHGFAAAASDGEHVASQIDPRTGLMIHSLYGATMKPTPDMFDGLDLVVCDLQDIGVRYYTYAWTVTYMLEAAGAAGIPVMVLDRPNPLGDWIDGQLLDMAYASMVGRAPIPIQHGLTLGELAKLFNTKWNPTPAELTVIPCDGYRCGMTWEETGLPFVPTSPAMPHLSTVEQYPGTCLVEGTNLSEGRGTALPFEIVGAPFIDSDKLIERLNTMNFIGTGFRPHSFKPTASKFAGEVCHGIQVHRVGSDFHPLKVWIAVISAIRHLYPDQFEWKPSHFDRLAGSSKLRQQIDAGESTNDIIASWADDLAQFQALRREVLIYG